MKGPICLWLWVCQSNVQDSSGDVVSSCVYSNKSMRYFHKCKIALIAIRLLLFQAISWPLDWSGQDFQYVFPPVAPVEVGFTFTNIYLFGRIWKCNT